MNTLSRARGVRLGVGFLAFAAVTAATCPIARYRIFTGFLDHDDEGYMLISLKSFLDHGWIYEGVTGYGPFYYQFWGAVFSIFGIPVSHDDGRAMTMVVWVLSSLLIGLATWRMTSSIVLGLATLLSAFEALFSLVNEPMHPGGLIVLLLSVIFLSSCFVRDRPARFSIALVGGAVMALILIKINVGVFALTAMILIGVISYPIFIRRRWLRPMVEAGFVALPLLLMRPRLGDASFRHFALHVFAAALAVVIALRARYVGHRDSKELWWLGGGVLAVGGAVSLAVLVTGGSPSGLIDGLIMLPLHFPSIASAPLPLLPETYVLDVLALAGALGYWYVARHRAGRPGRTWTSLVAALSILVGLIMAFSVIASITRFTPATTLVTPGFYRWELLAFAWVALIQPPGKPDYTIEFARVLLPPLAVLQTLHAYPLAGSQMYWSSLLLIPVGALCIANGVRWTLFSRAGQSEHHAPIAIGAVAATVAIVALVSIHLKHGFDDIRAGYRGSVSLGLPGANDVHVGRDEAANYRAVVAAIDQNCESFVSMPGMNSFYLWTRQKPPPGYDPTSWSMVWTQGGQQKAVEALRSIERLCLVENVALKRFWNSISKSPPRGPLYDYLLHGFVPVAKFGDYQLLRRDGNGGRS